MGAREGLGTGQARLRRKSMKALRAAGAFFLDWGAGFAVAYLVVANVPPYFVVMGVHL